MDLNNREIAVLIWLAISVGCVAISANCRRSFADVLRVLFSRKILQVIAATILWVVASVWLLTAVGVWKPDNLKTTLVWTMTFAFVAMFDVNRISENDTFYGKTIRDILSLTAVVTFIADSYSFSLIVELALIPLLIFITASQAITSLKHEYAQVKNLFGWLLALIGVTYIGHGIVLFLSDISNFATVSNLREFTIPSILSLLFLPYIYFLNAYITYEMKFVIVRHFIKDHVLCNYAMRKALFGFGLNLELLRRWSREIVLILPTNRSSIEQSIKDIKGRKAREINPPPVAVSDGWSPYAAKEFLTGVGLATGYYQPSDNEWFASSTLVELGSGLFPDVIAYYVEGDEFSAKRLKLILNVNNPAEPSASLNEFRRVAEILILAAVGTTPQLGLDGLTAAKSVDVIINGRRISLKHDNYPCGAGNCYSLRLTVDHSPN